MPMDYSNALTVHDYEGNMLGFIVWFSDEQVTLTEAKKLAKPLLELGWFGLAFSSGHISSDVPTFIVTEENENYGETN